MANAKAVLSNALVANNASYVISLTAPDPSYEVTELEVHMSTLVQNGGTDGELFYGFGITLNMANSMACYGNLNIANSFSRLIFGECECF